MPHHCGLIPSRRSSWSRFAHARRCRLLCVYPNQPADLKVLLHSRVRCIVRRCRQDGARCSPGLGSPSWVSPIPAARFSEKIRYPVRILPKVERSETGSRAVSSRGRWKQPAGAGRAPRIPALPGQRPCRAGVSSLVQWFRRVGGPLSPLEPPSRPRSTWQYHVSRDDGGNESADIPCGGIRSLSAEPKLLTWRPVLLRILRVCRIGACRSRLVSGPKGAGLDLSPRIRSEEACLGVCLPAWFHLPSHLFAGAWRWRGGIPEPRLRAVCRCIG